MSSQFFNGLYGSVESMPDRVPIPWEPWPLNTAKAEKVGHETNKKWSNIIQFSQIFQQLYPMTKEIRGQCLIMNNENFDDGDIREGSSMDVRSSNYLFSSLGFEVS